MSVRRVVRKKGVGREGRGSDGVETEQKRRTRSQGLEELGLDLDAVIAAYRKRTTKETKKLNDELTIPKDRRDGRDQGRVDRRDGRDQGREERSVDCQGRMNDYQEQEDRRDGMDEGRWPEEESVEEPRIEEIDEIDEIDEIEESEEEVEKIEESEDESEDDIEEREMNACPPLFKPPVEREGRDRVAMVLSTAYPSLKEIVGSEEPGGTELIGICRFQSCEMDSEEEDVEVRIVKECKRKRDWTDDEESRGSWVRRENREEEIELEDFKCEEPEKKKQRRSRRTGSVPKWGCRGRVPNRKNLKSYLERLAKDEPLEFDGEPAVVLAKTYEHYEREMRSLKLEVEKTTMTIEKCYDKLGKIGEKAKELQPLLGFLHFMRLVHPQGVGSAMALSYGEEPRIEEV